MPCLLDLALRHKRRAAVDYMIGSSSIFRLSTERALRAGRGPIQIASDYNARLEAPL